MLIKCPRCGFQQPKDRYCAQCGVDIDHYRPPQTSFGKKILGNPAFQISLVLCIAAVVGLSLYQRRRDDLQERVNYFKNGAQVARSVSSPYQTATESPEDSAPQPAAIDDTDEPNQQLASESAPSAENQLAAKNAAPTTPTTTAPAKPAVPPRTPPPGAATVRVFFTELSPVAREQLLADAAAIGQVNTLGDFLAGIAPDLGRKLTPSNREIKIHSREQRTLELGSPVHFFQGVRPNDPDGELGLSYYIELQDSDGSVDRGTIEIVRSWREGTPPTLQKKTFPASFELSRGSGFFMLGLLPRINPPDLENELVPISPFQILRSPPFRSGVSDSAIFIEFDRP